MLEQLAEDLRTLTLADAQQLRLRLQPCSLSAELAELQEAWQPQAECLGKGLLLNVSQDAATCTLRADPLRFRQVMGNLLDNALRYALAEVTLSVAQGTASSILFQIDDDGPGALPDELARLFDRFYQVDQARAFQGAGASRHGSGLGLPIVRALTLAHGGTIGASASRLGGLCLSLRWPTAEALEGGNKEEFRLLSDEPATQIGG